MLVNMAFSVQNILSFLLQFKLLLKFAGSSVKQSVRGMMSHLCTNNLMSFISMSGRNFGKLAFGDRDTQLCAIIVGMYIIVFINTQTYE